MMGGVANIDWKDISVAVPSFLTIAFMAFAYNISYGIAFGLISYVLIKVFSGKAKEVKGIYMGYCYIVLINVLPYTLIAV